MFLGFFSVVFSTAVFISGISYSKAQIAECQILNFLVI